MYVPLQSISRTERWNTEPFHHSMPASMDEAVLNVLLFSLNRGLHVGQLLNSAYNKDERSKSKGNKYFTLWKPVQEFAAWSLLLAFSCANQMIALSDSAAWKYNRRPSYLRH